MDIDKKATLIMTLVTIGIIVMMMGFALINIKPTQPAALHEHLYTEKDGQITYVDSPCVMRWYEEDIISLCLYLIMTDDGEIYPYYIFPTAGFFLGQEVHVYLHDDVPYKVEPYPHIAPCATLLLYICPPPIPYP